MKMKQSILSTTLLLTISILCSASPLAEEAVVRTIVLNAQSRFVPEKITVPRNVKFLLIVRNESTSNDEFESDDLGTEKAMKPGQSVNILLGPLRRGTYQFTGDMHRDTAKGQIIVE